MMLAMENGAQCLSAKRVCVTRHSRQPSACAIGYAGQFAVSKKADTVACGVFRAAVVQNSRKWKSERAEMKKEIRQRGEEVRRRVRRVVRDAAEKAVPRIKARAAMPDRDMDWFG